MSQNHGDQTFIPLSTLEYVKLKHFSFFTGLQYPTESKFVQRLRELEKTQNRDEIPLIPSTPEEMEEMLKLCSYVRFKIPKQVCLWKSFLLMGV